MFEYDCFGKPRSDDSDEKCLQINVKCYKFYYIFVQHKNKVMKQLQVLVFAVLCFGNWGREGAVYKPS